MLNIVITILICIGLIIERYLAAYVEEEKLPYTFGYWSFAVIFAISYSVSFIWMLGFVSGIIISLLCFFQIIYSSILWIFSIPELINIKKKNIIPKVNLNVYGGYSIIVMFTAILTISNFFISPYKSIWIVIEDDINVYVIFIISIIVIGNILKKIFLSKILKG